MISRNKILKISSMRRGLLFVAVVTLCFGLCHTREAKGNKTLWGIKSFYCLSVLYN